jgi:hypothetical protein
MSGIGRVAAILGNVTFGELVDNWKIKQKIKFRQ